MRKGEKQIIPATKTLGAPYKNTHLLGAGYWLLVAGFGF
jgi:hypothetical protein